MSWQGTDTETKHLGIVQTNQALIADESNPLSLASGQTLWPVALAYETYGTLNTDQSNAILICHAWTGTAHAAGWHQVDGQQAQKPGWWNEFIGPGKAFDTDRFFIICSNVLGGCAGSTGPCSVRPSTEKPYGSDFPVVTIGDMVEAQARLVSYLGINRLHAVAGGSMGGFQALDWAIRFPKRVNKMVCLASAARWPAQALAFNAVGRHAILNDPDWQNGYYDPANPPSSGLAMARMLAHITFLSEASFEAKFGRRLQSLSTHAEQATLSAVQQHPEFAVESYLTYQGTRFIEQFDANSYLALTKALDYFDLASQYGSLLNAFKPVQSDCLIASFTSDWMFPTKESLQIAKALRQLGKTVSFCELSSTAGHDAFLLESEQLTPIIQGFIQT